MSPSHPLTRRKNLPHLLCEYCFNSTINISITSFYGDNFLEVVVSIAQKIIPSLTSLLLLS